MLANYVRTSNSFLGVLWDLLLILYFSKKCGILNVGSRVYEITCNITKKGRVAARPFSCLFFVLIVKPVAVGSYN